MAQITHWNNTNHRSFCTIEDTKI